MAFIYSFTDLWNVGGTTFDAIKVDVTDTASAAASLLLNLSVGGSVKFSVRKDGHVVAATEAIGGATIGTNALAVMGTVNISGNTTLGSTAALLWSTDLSLFRDAANILAQRNGTTAQTFRVYNTFTDASNYEAIAFRYNSNIAQVVQISAGTGLARVLGLYGGAGLVLSGDINTGEQWRVSTLGNLINGANGPNYIGWSAAGIVADVTLSRNAAGIIQFGTTAANAAGSWLATNGTLAAGGKLSFTSGTNQRAGNATLVAGTVTVSNTTVTANTVVMLTRKTSGGTLGTAITYTLSAGTSFTINSDNILDTSTFSYMLIEVP